MSCLTDTLRREEERAVSCYCSPSFIQFRFCHTLLLGILSEKLMSKARATVASYPGHVKKKEWPGYEARAIAASSIPGAHNPMGS